MKRITNANYRSDKYYPRVVRAVSIILDRQGFVAPIDLFVEMSLLDKQGVAAWRKGQIPYLEKVIHCNLAVSSRILRILRMHAHDLNLRPSLTGYMRHTKGPKTRLRFTKFCEPRLEEAYARHFVRIPSKRELRERLEKPSEPPLAEHPEITETAEHKFRGPDLPSNDNGTTSPR
jgi:hypothetical protein